MYRCGVRVEEIVSKKMKGRTHLYIYIYINSYEHFFAENEGLVQVTCLRYTEMEDPNSLLVALTVSQVGESVQPQQVISQKVDMCLFFISFEICVYLAKFEVADSSTVVTVTTFLRKKKSAYEIWSKYL